MSVRFCLKALNSRLSPDCQVEVGVQGAGSRPGADRLSQLQDTAAEIQTSRSSFQDEIETQSLIEQLVSDKDREERRERF